MESKKPVRKPMFRNGCETCEFKGSEFTIDEKEPDVTRGYCKARHVSVNVELMSKDCDFYRIDPAQIKPKIDENRYGL